VLFSEGGVGEGLAWRMLRERAERGAAKEGTKTMSTDHLVIKLDPKPDTPAGWLSKAKGVVAAAKANTATFQPIAQLLAQLDTDTTTLDGAEAAAKNRGKDEIKTRNAAWYDLKKSLRAFARGVQALCDAAPDLEHAKAIAAAARLDAKVATVPHRPDFYGTALGAGAVRLRARRPVKRSGAFFMQWQMSTDGGETWLPLPGTNTASTLVQGLTPVTLVQFRQRSMVKNVASDWSQVIVVQVH
jgi:hypothetical protein